MRVLRRGDPDYPAGLEALADPPAQLFVDGALPPPDAPRVALVGARRATAAGRDVAARLARELATAGVVVVSGGALGIDAAAHEGALEGGGRTLVVLPTSLEVPYPRSNARLFRRVVEAGGACLAEHDASAPVGRWRFVERNRLVAALSDAVVVIEARAQSGTAATASVARQLGRPLGAVPWRLADEGGAGCLALLREGARVVASAEDVRDLIPAHRRPPPLSAAVLDPRSLRGLLTARGPSTAAALAEACGRPVVDVLRELTELELSGQVAPAAGGRFRAVA